MTLYILCLFLFCIGLYGVLRKRNIVKIIIGFSIMGYAMNLFFVMMGYRMKGRAPISSLDQNVFNMVDPLPQELVHTSIVIGLGLTALLIAIAIKIFEKCGTFDITKLRKLKG